MKKLLTSAAVVAMLGMGAAFVPLNTAEAQWWPGGNNNNWSMPGWNNGPTWGNNNGQRQWPRLGQRQWPRQWPRLGQR